MTLDSKAIQAGILLLVACAAGGGGSHAGLANLVVELTALALLAINGQLVLHFFKSAPRPLIALVCASLLLPLLQSVPLPPAVWQSLPGRDLVAQSFGLIGRSNAWFPMSLAVERTLLAFFAMLVPLAMLILVWGMDGSQQRPLLVLLLIIGGGTVLLGAQQLVTGNQWLIPYDQAVGTPDLQGIFANRNATGVFFDIILCVLVGILPRGQVQPKWLVFGVAMALLLILGLVLTRSRSSMVLAIVPFAFALFRFTGLRMGKRLSRGYIVGVAVALAVLAGGGMLAASNVRVQKSLVRFERVADDPRWGIWSDSMNSIKRFWPLGSGIGSFAEINEIDESLENLSPTVAPRVHNDFLEPVLESGAVGMLLLGAWCLFLTIAMARALRRGRAQQVGVFVLLVMALQSISDYPLRNLTLLCIAGFMLALIIHPSSQAGENGPRAVSRRKQ